MENLTVGMPDLSAITGVVASLKMPLDPPVDTTSIDGAGASGTVASKYAGNGNDDGSDEVCVLVYIILRVCSCVFVLLISLDYT
jgi:hypothetical protein